MVEFLETRALLADGITPAAGPPINAVVGVPITNAVFATYTISDSSGEPGTQWRAEIQFGDGQVDKQLVPVPVGTEFEFEDTHTYTAPGTYTVTVMIAVPGSREPRENVVTTQVTVTSPTPSIGNFKATGLKAKVSEKKTFHWQVAHFSEPHTNARGFSAIVDWGDQSSATPGQIRTQGKGRYAVIGSHRYVTPGVYKVTVTVRDASGREIAAMSAAHVVR